MTRAIANAAAAFGPSAPACHVTERGSGCITCGDVAIPMNVLRLDEDRGLALCADDDGNSETVETDLVAPVAPGDRLLVHAGTAIARLGATEEAPV
jgi:hydrogenase assembly chaperone HypC/HupF